MQILEKFESDKILNITKMLQEQLNITILNTVELIKNIMKQFCEIKKKIAEH